MSIDEYKFYATFYDIIRAKDWVDDTRKTYGLLYIGLKTTKHLFTVCVHAMLAWLPVRCLKNLKNPVIF